MTRSDLIRPSCSLPAWHKLPEMKRLAWVDIIITDCYYWNIFRFLLPAVVLL